MSIFIKSPGSLYFDFQQPEDAIVKESQASTKTVGTRFSLVLIDAGFRRISKEEINDFIDKKLEAIR